MKVEIFSDVACPWCYIGERRFAAALERFEAAGEVEVVFRPFQLDPDAPRSPQPMLETLAAKFGATAEAKMRQVGTAAGREGIVMNWNVAQSVNTLEAHRLLRLAETEYGPAVQLAVLERLFAAYFVDGGNIADHALLATIAVDAGIDRGRAEAYLASDEGCQEVLGEIAIAQRIGVRAVPTFVFNGRHAVEGAQPVEVFAEILDELHRESKAIAVDDGDACADGVCAVEPQR